MSLKDKNVVVTGGSRGLGLGLVEALVAHGARVTVVARDADAFESVRARLGVATISADVTDETAAHRILAEVRPDRGAERRRAPVFGSSSFRPLRHPEEKLAPLCVVIPMPQFPNVLAAPPLHLAILALKKIVALQLGRHLTPGNQVRAELGQTERSAQLVRVGFAKRVSDGRIAPCCPDSAELRSRVDGIPLLSILRCLEAPLG